MIPPCDDFDKTLAKVWLQEMNGDIEVTDIVYFRKDVKVIKKSTGISPFPDSKRGAIKEFSTKSRLAMAFFIRNCSGEFYSMLTLTYPKDFPSDGRQVKKHRKAFIEILVYQGFSGVWFLEFQKRGAPHFHILSDCKVLNESTLTRTNGRTYTTDLMMQEKFCAQWFKIVNSGDVKHLKAGVCFEKLLLTDAAQRYASKHASKPRQKEVSEGYENVGRFWGQFGGRKALSESTLQVNSADMLHGFTADQMISSKGRIKKIIWDFEDARNDLRLEKVIEDQDDIPY